MPSVVGQRDVVFSDGRGMASVHRINFPEENFQLSADIELVQEGVAPSSKTPIFIRYAPTFSTSSLQLWEAGCLCLQ